MPPAGCGTLHPAGEESVGTRQADGLDPFIQLDLAVQLHQGYIVTLLGVRVFRRDHHTPNAAAHLKGVPAIQLVPTNIDDVGGDVIWTMKVVRERERDRETNTYIHRQQDIFVGDHVVDIKQNFMQYTKPMDQKRCHCGGLGTLTVKKTARGKTPQIQIYERYHATCYMPT